MQEIDWGGQRDDYQWGMEGVGIAASDESSKVGTFKWLQGSDESIFKFAEACKNVYIFLWMNRGATRGAAKASSLVAV